MNKKQIYRLLAGLTLLTLLLGVVLSAVIPPWIQSLLQKPNDSYITAILLKHQLRNPSLHTVEYYATYIPQVIRRILCMGLLFTSAVILLLTLGREHLRRFWNHPSTAFNLGVLRIFIMWDALAFDFSMLPSFVDLNYEGINIPTGYHIFRPWLPPPAALVFFLHSAYLVLAKLVMVGFLTRLTLPLMVVVSFFTLLFPQFVGKMNHYHHIWLGTVFLSLSPCGDALSVDWLIRKWRGRATDVHRLDQRYGRPMVYMWCMMGAIYFFPGFWKFAASGFDWAFSDNVQLKILTKIWETGEQPEIALYKYPLLCKLGGLGTLIFELAFPFAMIFPLTRTLFGMGGILFHESNRRITQIGFTSIEYFYVSFVNWSWLLRRPSVELPPLAAHFPRWKTVLCTIMVGGLWFAGPTAIESWPWANYPTFAPLEQRFVNSIEMRMTLPGQPTQTLLLQDDPALIEFYNNRTRLRSYLTLVMMQPNESERAKMLISLFDVWKRKRQLTQLPDLEFWQVQVPLIPLGAPPEPFKILGKISASELSSRP